MEVVAMGKEPRRESAQWSLLGFEARRSSVRAVRRHAVGDDDDESPSGGRQTGESRQLAEHSNVERLDVERLDVERLDVERLIETDVSLVPTGPSAMLVEPAVLEPEEVAALLADLD